MNGATMLAVISGILIYMAGILTWLLVEVATKKKPLNNITIINQNPDFTEENTKMEETK